MLNKKTKDINKNIVCNLLADFPWVVNLNYSSIPKLNNKGLDYSLNNNTKIDLLLKDEKCNKIVAIEIKTSEFDINYVNQLVEKRDDIIDSYSNTSILNDIFKEEILKPVMVLVLPICSDYDKLICSQSDIKVYEYYKPV